MWHAKTILILGQAESIMQFQIQNGDSVGEDQAMYNAMARVEMQREKRDLLYHVLLNTEASTLDDVVQQITSHISDKFGDDKSARLKNMLQKVNASSDRVAKHAVIFFALDREPRTRELFMNDAAPRVPPEKFQHFVDKELPILVEKLMKGAFTSLRAFVEDVRWTYATL